MGFGVPWSRGGKEAGEKGEGRREKGEGRGVRPIPYFFLAITA
jgi:hypothetical protein